METTTELEPLTFHDEEKKTPSPIIIMSAIPPTPAAIPFSYEQRYAPFSVDDESLMEAPEDDEPTSHQPSLEAKDAYDPSRLRRFKFCNAVPYPWAWFFLIMASAITATYAVSHRNDDWFHADKNGDHIGSYGWLGYTLAVTTNDENQPTLNSLGYSGIPIAIALICQMVLGKFVLGLACCLACRETRLRAETMRVLYYLTSFVTFLMMLTSFIFIPQTTMGIQAQFYQFNFGPSVYNVHASIFMDLLSILLLG